jgi:FkbM family methyltransferase
MNRKVVFPIRKIMEDALGINDLYGHLMINGFEKFPVVVDLGAGTGELPQKILEKYPSSRIILVEPDPSLFQELKKKFAKQDNVETLEAAIGKEKNNYGTFYLSKNWQGNSLHKSLIAEKDIQGGIAARIVTLEDIFLLFHLEKIDFLKVDIEGEEWNVFENFSKHDFERIQQISVEFHDFLDPSLRERSERCIKLLKEFGYSFIHKGTKHMYGTPYYDCLFYDRKRLNSKAIVKWLSIPTTLSSIFINFGKMVKLGELPE